MWRDARLNNYDLWTRHPVAYLPITLGDKLLGYLWGGKSGAAAGIFPPIVRTDPDPAVSVHWFDNLKECYRQRLTPVEALRYWVGKPEHPQYGGISGDAELGEAASIQELFESLNRLGSHAAPLGDGPLVQDGTYPDGTPAEKDPDAEPVLPLWLPGYASTTTTPIEYLPIEHLHRGYLRPEVRDRRILGYIWASTTEDAAGYLPRTSAGRRGDYAGDLWRERFRRCRTDGLSAIEALRRIRHMPNKPPKYFGEIDTGRAEKHAASLSELQWIEKQRPAPTPRPQATRATVRSRYDVWTSRPLAYLPVTLGDTLIGYLWGSDESNAANFFAREESGIDALWSASYWHDRLNETHLLGLSPVEAIKHWIGKPADPKYGGIAADAELGEARSASALSQMLRKLSPELAQGKPLARNGHDSSPQRLHPTETPFGQAPQSAPLLSDSYNDPDNRWGSLQSAPRRPYSTETTAPIVYLPVTRYDTLYGYLWVSLSNDAAGYLDRVAMGVEGSKVGAFWLSCCIDAYTDGLSPLEGFQRIRNLRAPSYDLYGEVESKHRARIMHLELLRRMAEEQ
ncbi:hypothetical protein [Nocardia sp. NPDC050406]|uniref:hypothetical protein n=1 Tax=Nocardia sp. NPDC050406 TaxID=3364318 RepID=UPI00379EA99D